MKSLDHSELAVGIYPTFSENLFAQVYCSICTADHTDVYMAMVVAAYDARGGGGVASTKDLGNGKLHVTFDPETLYIPDVNYKTAKFLGAPMGPPFRIQIKPVKLEVLLHLVSGHACDRVMLCLQTGLLWCQATGCLQGYIDKSTGQAELQFIANFMFTAGALYKV